MGRAANRHDTTATASRIVAVVRDISTTVMGTSRIVADARDAMRIMTRGTIAA